MEIIIKSKKKKEAFCLLFGLKNLSTYDNIITLEELKEMDTSKIFIAIDKNIFNDDLKDLKEALQELNKLNIKGIFFYDLAVLNLCKKLNINIPLIWNQNFLVTNYKTCNYYEKEGVQGAVLSSEITIDEILEIKNHTKLDLFVNLFGYQTMAISKRHLISSYFDYLNEENEEKINYIIENNDKYQVVEDSYGTKFLTKDILNGIRYIKKLKDKGIKYIILNDEGIEKETFLKICDYFKQAINTNDENEIMKIERDINSLVKTSLGFLDKKTIYKVK